MQLEMENPLFTHRWVVLSSPCGGRSRLHPAVTNAYSTMVANAYDRESNYRDRKEEPDVPNGDIVPSIEPTAP